MNYEMNLLSNSIYHFIFIIVNNKGTQRDDSKFKRCKLFNEFEDMEVSMLYVHHMQCVKLIINE